MTEGFYFALLKRSLPWIFPSLPHVIIICLGIYFLCLKNRQFNIFLIFVFVTTAGAAFLNLLKCIFHESFSLAGYQFDRFFLISPLFYSILIAYTLQNLPQRNIRVGFYKKDISVKNVCYILIFVWLFIHTGLIKFSNIKLWLRHGSYAANYQSKQMDRLVSENKSNQPFRVATAVSLIFPAYAMAYGLESSDGYLNLYSMRYKKFWSKVIHPLFEKNKKINNYFDNWGNRIYLYPPTEIPSAEIVLKEYYNLNLLSLANTKYIISRSKLIDDNLLLIQNPEKEFYKLSPSEKIKTRIEENFQGNKTLFIYENKSFLPRFFLAKNVVVYNSSDELLDDISKRNFSDFKETIYLEKSDLDTININNIDFHNGIIKLEKYSPDHITLNIRLDGKGFLVVSNSYSPYWKVSINNNLSKIIPAYHTFWGVLLESGENKIIFYYDPPVKVL